MRTLEPAERVLLDRFANAIDGALGERLRLDSGLAVVVEEHNSPGGRALIFQLEGYERPEYRGQGTYPVDAFVFDADGVRIYLQLFRDQSDRLFELLMNKESMAPVLDPDLTTLEFF
jgi:hypothetical protein